MKTPGEFAIKIIGSAPLEDLRALYLETGWVRPDEKVPPSVFEKILAQSFCFVGVFDNGRLIGMGRALSDGVSDAYIQDVTVLKVYRKQGLGKKIIKTLIDELHTRGIGWIGLIAEPGTSEFYIDLGFKTMEHYTPMLLRSEK